MISISRDRCLYCGGCVGICPRDALTLYETALEVDDRCNGCSLCAMFCPVRALESYGEV